MSDYTIYTEEPYDIDPPYQIYEPYEPRARRLVGNVVVPKNLPLEHWLTQSLAYQDGHDRQKEKASQGRRDRLILH